MAAEIISNPGEIKNQQPRTIDAETLLRPSACQVWDFVVDLTGFGFLRPEL